MPDRKFWKDKSVFITGHTGFKGSWLSCWLRRMGARVTGFALPPSTNPSMFEVARSGAGIVSVTGDVRDIVRVSEVMKEACPEIVIHMAAQALVKTAYADPVTTYTTNVIGTLNVLQAVRNTSSVRVVVSITSDKCYENSEWVWGYRENDRLGGVDPYSSSKACAELLIASYRESYFTPRKAAEHGVRLASARAGNVIGGGDWSDDRLIPDIMRALLTEREVFIRRPSAIRPWQFVLEPLRGYLDLAERLWSDEGGLPGAWNFGPDVEEIKPVNEIVEYITRKWGEGARWRIDEGIHPHEHCFLKLDCTKAKSLLGWKPALGLADTLDWIVDWYKRYNRGEDARLVTEEQIDQYEQLLH